MDILIFGAGGHASKISALACESGLNICGFISTEKKGTLAHNSTVIGNLSEFLNIISLHTIKSHIAIGNNSVRKNIYDQLGSLADNLISIISHSSFISNNVSLMHGSSVLQSAVLQPNVFIGKCCIVDSGSVVEHDCNIGDFSNISPNSTICGGSTLGEGVIIGAGAVVIEKINIGKNSLIGAGSVVLNDIPEMCVAVGNPARIIKRRNIYDPYLR